MSKVRREKHKALVFWGTLDKHLYRVESNTYNLEPRWRQHKKAEDERIAKK